jgi:macrolide-specific efflux system membrane fusion protein
MKASKPMILGLAAVVVIVAVVGVVVVRTSGAKAPQYITADARMADVESAVLATGSLQPFDVVNVGAQTSGQVTKVNVRLGDHVKKGQLIALIESQQLDNQVRNTESQLTNQRAFLNIQQANLSANKANLDRQQKLYDAQVGTVVSLEQAKATLRQNEAQIAQAEAQVRQREIEVEAARNNLDKTNIRAPLDALVAEVVTKEGTTINANQSTPTIVRLAKMDTMTVRAQISEADINKVRPGQKVYFTLLGDPNKRYYATLRTREVTPASGTLDPTAGGQRQQQAVYYNALFEVPNAEGDLFPAMTAEVHVVLAGVSNVLTIPAVALGTKLSEGHYEVRVAPASGKAAETRTITTGLNNRFLVEVKSGLKVGDKVVIGEAGGATAAAPAKPLFGGVAAPQ